MKRRKEVFAVLLIICSITLACVPTPNEEYIAQKDMTQMIEQAKRTPVSDMVQNENDQPVQNESTMSSVMTQPEERIQLSFKGKTTEDFCVEVDAKVTRPNVSLPIIRVSADDFDEETANRFFAVLTEGFDLYTPDQLDTAPALDEKIQKAMNEIANGNDEQPMKDYLNDLIEKRKTASSEIGDPVEHIDPQEDTYLFSLNEKETFHAAPNTVEYNGQINKFAKIVFADQEVFNERNIMTSYMWREMQNVKDMQFTPERYPDLIMTPKQAETAVVTLLLKLNLKDFRVSDLLIIQNDNYDSAYIAFCNRYWNDIQIAHPAAASGTYEGSTSPIWGYEQVIIILNDKGIALFQYSAPLKIENLVVEEANLLPFEDVMEHFQNMMCTKYEIQLIEPTYHLNALTYYITDITLTLQRINEQDNIDYGLLVPVWNFWGYNVHVNGYDGQTYEEHHIDGWYGSEPILSINAINGNIIDPINGY